MTLHEHYPFLPRLDFPPLAGFWAAAEHGELALPRCDRCRRWEWYPGWQCAACGGDLNWRPVRPRGLVHSFTTVEHPFSREFGPLVPFDVALVTPEGAPEVRIVLRVKPSRFRTVVGAPVNVEFQRLGEISVPAAVVSGEP